MAEGFEFEVRPIAGASAAVGEAVTFRKEGGKLLALNEDGEAFGTVPRAFAAKLQEMGLEGLDAQVAGRSDGVPLVTVTVPATDAAAGTEATSTADAPVSGAPEDATPAEAQATPDTAQAPQQPGAPAGSVGQSYEQFLAGGVTGETSAGAGAAATTTQPTKKTGKYVAIVAAAVVAILIIIVCVAIFATPKTQTVTSDWMSVEVPADWTVDAEDEEDEGVYIYPDDYTGQVHMSVITENDDVETGYEVAEWGMSLIDDYDETGFDIGDREELAIGDAVVWRYEVNAAEIEIEDYGTAECQGFYEFVFSGDEFKVITAYCLADEYDEHADELLEILDNLALENPTTPGESLEDGGSSDADSDEDAEEEEAEETQTVSDGSASLEAPASWEVLEDDGEYTIRNDDHSVVIILSTMADILDGDYSANSIASSVLSGVNSNYDDEDNYSYADSDTLESSETDDGMIVYSYDYEQVYEGAEYLGVIQLIFSGDDVTMLAEVCLEDDLEEYEDTIEDILESVAVEDPSEPNVPY